MEFQSEKDAWDYIKRRQDELRQQFKLLSDEEMSRAIDEIMQVHEKYKSARIAEVCAGILYNCSWRQSLESAKESVTRLSELYAAHRDNDTVLWAYATSLFNLTDKQDLTGCQEAVLRLSELYTTHRDNDTVLGEYADSLVNLTVEQDLTGCQETVLRLSELYTSHRDNDTVLWAYAHSLVNLTDKQDLTGCQEAVLRLSELYTTHRDNDTVLGEYAHSLVNLTVEQDLTGCQETVLRLRELYTTHRDNDTVLWAYAHSLVNLTVEQDLTGRQETVLRLSELYTTHRDNDTVLVAYANSLAILTVEQDLTGCQETVLRLSELYTSHSNNDTVLSAYTFSLIDLAQKKHNDKKNLEDLSKLSGLTIERRKREGKPLFEVIFQYLLFKECDVAFLKKVIEAIVDSSSEANSITELWKHYVSTMEFDSSSYPTVTSKDDLINRILLVNSVKIIMNTLMMRDLSEVDISHYTSMNNIKFLLQNPNPNKDKDDKAALRLYNATYMNDPEEGKALINYFKREGEQPIQWLDDEEGSSSIYLCSLTMEEDKLPLWSQYGKDGKGACIGFKDDFFDTSIRVNEQTIKLSFIDINETTGLKESRKLPLYRVCYIDNVEKKLMCEGLGSKKLSIIRNHLKNIRDMITNEKNKEMQEFFKEVVDEIRYLFKDKGYSHEREVRLLENVPMSSDRLKLDNRPDLVAPKLYIDYETPILIRKIIFGPKAERTEVLKPYIKYCDPNIEIKHSTIKYR
ncbi:DUF2971 domain-containing protein [Aerococcaceae bacterium NML190073]|nr:DUF2971 domain-containing protein [Aerococcaceae bacterium NML190073]